MELILWRHAEAEDGVPDAERALTNKGLQQAEKMATWLKAQLADKMHDTRIIVSPAKRTQQTARALNQAFETSVEVGTGTTVNRMHIMSEWPDATGTTIIVGHQPTLGEFARILVPHAPSEYVFKKGATWWFGHEKNSQGDIKLVLRTVMYPDML